MSVTLGRWIFPEQSSDFEGYLLRLTKIFRKHEKTSVPSERRRLTLDPRGKTGSEPDNKPYSIGVYEIVINCVYYGVPLAMR